MYPDTESNSVFFSKITATFHKYYSVLGLQSGIQGKPEDLHLCCFAALFLFKKGDSEAVQRFTMLKLNRYIFPHLLTFYVSLPLLYSVSKI